MPQIGDQVQTSTLAFADHGAKITGCKCTGCDHAYWDSDRDTPRDFSETQCFDQCVTESKCKFALYDAEFPRNTYKYTDPQNRQGMSPDGQDLNPREYAYKNNAVIDRTAGGVKVTRKCWLYEHVPDDGIGKVAALAEQHLAHDQHMSPARPTHDSQLSGSI
jgi:hypothetical protein